MSSTLPQRPDRTADLEAGLEELRDLVCDQGDELAQLALEHAELLRRLRRAAPKQTPYERAAASTQPLSVRLAAAGLSVVRDGG